MQLAKTLAKMALFVPIALVSATVGAGQDCWDFPEEECCSDYIRWFAIECGGWITCLPQEIYSEPFIDRVSAKDGAGWTTWTQSGSARCEVYMPICETHNFPPTCAVEREVTTWNCPRTSHGVLGANCIR